MCIATSQTGYPIDLQVSQFSITIESSGCAFAWLLLLISVMIHTMQYRGRDDCDSDEDEVNAMYS